MGSVKKTTSGVIIEDILGRIQRGELTSGDRLTNERALAQELSVSRVPLREAICALSTMGILEARQGGGTYVSRYNPALIGKVIGTYTLFDRSLPEEVFQARMLLESDAARLAALNRTQQDLTLLRFAMNRYENAVRQFTGDLPALEKLMAYDNGVHLGIATASHNNFFVQMIDTIRHVKGAGLEQKTKLPEPSYLEESLKAHEKIFQTIEAQDCPGAHEAMQSHVLAFRG